MARKFDLPAGAKASITVGEALRRAMAAPRNKPIPPAVMATVGASGPLPHGTVIARFSVAGKAIPWQSPKVMNGVAMTPRRVKVWKSKVAGAAHDAGYGEARGIPPYSHPVELRVWFLRKADAKKRHGLPCPARPDWDNLAKGIGDSLTGRATASRNGPPSPIGRVLEDDNIVTDASVHKRWWARPMVLIEVIAVDGTSPSPPPGELTDAEEG